MLVILVLDHRLAFLALVVLLLAAATPLAFAWARVIPEERPSFEIEPAPVRPLKGRAAREESPRQKRDSIAIVLLVFVTLGYLIQFPGVPRHSALQWLNNTFPAIAPIWMSLGAEVLAAVVSVGVASYAFSKPSPLRIPLGVGAVLVLLLWLLTPFLQSALLAGS
jgi:hypothetical protein